MTPGWHPSAVRVPYQDAGSFIGGGHKIVWHTTEGVGLPRYSGTAPHFTLDPRRGKLWQHMSVFRAARALEHPPGTPDTNRANAVQVELIGSAKDTPHWSVSAYGHIARLARWIEAQTGVPRRCTVTFANTPHRLSGSAFVAYAGHLGHEHVANQPLNHWDPGAFRIDRVLAHGSPASPCDFFGLLTDGSRGADVRQVQRWINALAKEHPGHYDRLVEDGAWGGRTESAVRVFQHRHDLDVDGAVGPLTWRKLCQAAR